MYSCIAWLSPASNGIDLFCRARRVSANTGLTELVRTLFFVNSGPNARVGFEKCGLEQRILAQREDVASPDISQAFYCEGQYTALYEASALFPTSTYFNMSSPGKNALSLVTYRILSLSLRSLMKYPG